MSSDSMSEGFCIRFTFVVNAEGAGIIDSGEPEQQYTDAGRTQIKVMMPRTGWIASLIEKYKLNNGCVSQEMSSRQFLFVPFISKSIIY
jgi:hypothetical protein